MRIRNVAVVHEIREGVFREAGIIWSDELVQELVDVELVGFLRDGVVFGVSAVHAARHNCHHRSASLLRREVMSN
jgi:hypothetical protein